MACSACPAATTSSRSASGPGLGALSDGGLGSDAEESLCPAIPPKVGENCPSTMENQIALPVHRRHLRARQGCTYDITLDYCCARGTVWETCGTNTTPCDRDAVDGGAGPAATPDAG